MLPPVKDDGFGILETARQLLPVHPAGDEVGSPERRLRTVHDAKHDMGAIDGCLERGHSLRVSQSAKTDIVDQQEEVTFLSENVEEE